RGDWLPPQPGTRARPPGQSDPLSVMVRDPTGEAASVKRPADCSPNGADPGTGGQAGPEAGARGQAGAEPRLGSPNARPVTARAGPSPPGAPAGRRPAR